MKNIRGQYLLFGTNNDIPTHNWYRVDNTCTTSGYTKEQLAQRRKYETLKHSNNGNNLTKAQQYSRANKVYRNPQTYKTCSVESSHPPSASGLRGSWNIVVNKTFENVPVTNLTVRREYPTGPDSRYDSFNSTPPNFPTPFKILETKLFDIDVSSAKLYVNTIGAITDDNTFYSRDPDSWLKNGRASIFGGFYTSANNYSFTDISTVIFKMLETERTKVVYENIKITDNSSATFIESYNNYVAARNSLNETHIRLTPTDPNIKEKTGYLGKRFEDNKVYFISNRDYINKDYSYNTEEDISSQALYAFPNETLLNMSAVC
jgi:hypothetical protein